MKKNVLLNRLEELNSSLLFSSQMLKEYENIISELDSMGVPPLSQTLLDENDRMRSINSFPENIISTNTQIVLAKNGIWTIGDLLDLRRTSAMKFRGFGTKKWVGLYKIQKYVYDSCPHNNILTSEKLNHGEDDTIPYTIKELQDINKEMLDHEERKSNNSIGYEGILNELKKRGQKRSDVFKGEDFYDVPAAILYSLPRRLRISSLIDALGVGRLVEILDLTEEKVMMTPNQGRKSWTNVVALKRDVLENWKDYLKMYEEHHAIHVLPENVDGDPLYVRCIKALEQLAELVKKNGKEREAYLIREYFLRGKDRDTIINALPDCRGIASKVTYERLRQIIETCQIRLMSGSENPLVENAYFSDEFIDELNELPQKFLYHSLSHANKSLDAPEKFDCTPIARLLGLDIIEVTKDRLTFMDQPRIISSDDEKRNIAAHIKAIHYVMNALARPADKDEIISLVLNSKHLPKDFDLTIIERVLDDHEWIVYSDGKYSYPYEKLWDDNARAARIIYEKGDITTAQIKAIDKQLRPPKNSLAVRSGGIMSAYPWVQKGARNDQFIYSPQQTSAIIPIKTAVENYVQKHIRFYFSDMVKELQAGGYAQYAETSFRTYAMKWCLPSNNDGNLLCLETEKDCYPLDNWRARTTQGTTNWVINTCIRVLENKKLTKRNLRIEVSKQPDAEYYRVRDIFAYLTRYCCQDEEVNINKPFIVDEKYIWVNQECLDNGLVDLDKIGTINKQPDYYMTVMTKIVNQLKQSEEKRMRLVDLRNICMPLIDNPSKHTIFYKIVAQLPDEVEKIIDDDTIYLQYKQEKQTYETAYSITQDVKDKSPVGTPEDLPPVEETVKPQKEYRRGFIDWSEMVSELQQELGYYNRMWDVTTALNKGIERFVAFLRNADSDKVFHDDIIRHIYEFLTRPLDKYDLHDHLKAIALGFEPFVRKIYVTNNQNDAPQTSGLSECIALMPELKSWTQQTYVKTDFRKIYWNLYWTRNKFAHGADIEMNSINKYQSTFSYLALYIYVYNRFAKEVA